MSRTTVTVPHPLTRRQYHAERLKHHRQKHPDLDPATIAMQAKMDLRHGWWRTVAAYVAAGGKLRAGWLNTLADDPRLYHVIELLSPDDSAIPAGYVFPHCRSD